MKATVSKTVIAARLSRVQIPTSPPPRNRVRVPDLSRNLNDRLPDGRPVKRFYAVQDFFLSYFHPDWKLDDPSADAVIGRSGSTT